MVKFLYVPIEVAILIISCLKRPPKVSDIWPQKIFSAKLCETPLLMLKLQPNTMYTNLTCQDVSFTFATLSNILNDKHIPQKMQKPISQIQENRTKKCSDEFVR